MREFTEFSDLSAGQVVSVKTKGTGLGVYGQSIRVVEIIEVLKDIPSVTVYRVEVTHGTGKRTRALIPDFRITKLHKPRKRRASCTKRI